MNFQEQTGVCKKFSVNVRDYPKKFLEKCDGEFYEDDDKFIFYVMSAAQSSWLQKNSSEKLVNVKVVGNQYLFPVGELGS